jgi:hypothetical protein
MQTVLAFKSQCYCWYGTSLRLELCVQTRASKDAIIGHYGERIKVVITAVPIDGKANKHLIKFLAKYFAVSKSQIQIIAGEHSHYKTVLICLPKNHTCEYPR